MRWLEASDSYNELDRTLKQLVLTAKQHPPQSAKRQTALTNIHATILNSKKLWYPPKYQFNEDAYNEAKQELWCYVCKFIEKYDPKKGTVIAWINTLLSKRFYKDAYIEFLNITSTQNNYIEICPSIENSPSLLEEIWEYIELDPENIFEKEYIKNHPEANFRALILYRRSQVKWKDISRQLGIKDTTLIRFYQRCSEKFAQKIKEYLNY